MHARWNRRSKHSGKTRTTIGQMLSDARWESVARTPVSFLTTAIQPFARLSWRFVKIYIRTREDKSFLLRRLQKWGSSVDNCAILEKYREIFRGYIREKKETIQFRVRLDCLRCEKYAKEMILCCNVRELEQFLLDSKESVNDTNTTKKIVINPFWISFEYHLRRKFYENERRINIRRKKWINFIE